MTVHDFATLQAKRWQRLYGKRYPGVAIHILLQGPERFMLGCLRCAGCGQPHMTREELGTLLAPIDDFELALRAVGHEMMARTEKAGCMPEVQRLAELCGMQKDDTPQA